MCKKRLCSIFFLSMVCHLYEDFLTVPTGIISNIFPQEMVNLYPVEDSLFLGSYLGTTTIFTRKASDDFNGHRFSRFGISPDYLPIQFALLECGNFLFG